MKFGALAVEESALPLPTISVYEYPRASCQAQHRRIYLLLNATSPHTSTHNWARRIPTPACLKKGCVRSSQKISLKFAPQKCSLSDNSGLAELWIYKSHMYRAIWRWGTDVVSLCVRWLTFVFHPKSQYRAPQFPLIPSLSVKFVVHPISLWQVRSNSTPLQNCIFVTVAANEFEEPCSHYFSSNPSFKNYWTLKMRMIKDNLPCPCTLSSIHSAS